MAKVAKSQSAALVTRVVLGGALARQTGQTAWMTEAGGQHDEDGIGSLLMLDNDLPRDEFGWPYQALFYFQGERIKGLVYDDDGRVMAYRNTAQGDPLVEESTWQRAPEPIAAAAKEWWHEWRQSHP